MCVGTSKTLESVVGLVKLSEQLRNGAEYLVTGDG